MTGTESSFDTNILFYAFDRRDSRKHGIASLIVSRHQEQRAGLPLQVLSEFYRVSTKKLFPSAAAHALIEGLMANFAVVSTIEADVVLAMQLHEQHGFQFFDLLLVATLARAGCKTFLTEDMQHDRMISGVRILNPFLLASAELDALLA